MFELEFAARTDRGLVRKTSHDEARVLPALRLAIVVDGTGGHDAGEPASHTVANLLEQAFAQIGGPAERLDETADRLRAALRDASQGTAARPEGARSRDVDLVSAVFSHGHVVVGRVGSGRCYRLRGGTLDRITQGGSSAHLGQMGTSAALYMSADEGVGADTGTFRGEPGDLYLLCSDGLWGSVAEPALLAILDAAEDAEQACERLVGAAWAGGGLDSIGVAVVRLVPLRVHLDEPTWLEQPTQVSD